MEPIEDGLARNRPLPSAAFRGELRRSLLAGTERQVSSSRARFSILAYAGSGVLLLLVAAVGVLGGGPLAA